MNIKYRTANVLDLNRCFEIRGLTQDNAFSENDLTAIGVTKNLWSTLIEDGTLIGNIASINELTIGFCIGDTKSGEVLVLAVLAGYEGIGIGKNLLKETSSDLFSFGHSELWLAASATPVVRAYGFYRSVGWQPTNTFDGNGDEILTNRKI